MLSFQVEQILLPIENFQLELKLLYIWQHLTWNLTYNILMLVIGRFLFSMFAIYIYIYICLLFGVLLEVFCIPHL